MSVNNKQENKVKNKEVVVRGKTSAAAAYLCLDRSAHIKSVLAARAGVGTKPGSGNMLGSSNHPPGPSKALGDTTNTVCTEEAKFSFELYLSSTIS